MADISIVVQVVGEKDIIKTTSSLEKMERGVRKLSKDLSTGRIIEKQYNEGLKELRRTVDGSFGSWQKAKGAVDGYSKALKKANIAKEANDNVIALNKMRSTYDRNYAVEQKTLLLKKRLRKAIQDNKMTVREAGAELLRYRKALQQTNGTMQMTKRGTNQLGVMMQQTGYQVGDFAVQVGSGQNVMVAFGQQATQLVGTMAMFAKTTKMIALFSGLGILIPIITGIGAAMMRTSGSSKSLSENVDQLTTSFDDYISSASGAKTATEDLKRIYGEVTPEILALEERLQGLKLRQVALDAASVATSISNWDFTGSIFAEMKDVGATFGTGNKEAKSFIKTLQAIGEAKGPEATLAAIEKVVALTDELTGGVEGVDEKTIAFATAIAEAQQDFQQLVNIMGIAKVAQDDVSKSADKFLGFLNKTLDKIDETNAAQKLSNDALMSKTALMRVEQEYGAESLKYKKLAAAQEDVALIAKLKLKGVDEDLINFAVYQLQTQREITAEIERQSKVKFNMMEGSAAAQAMRKYAGRGTTSDKDPQTGDGTSIYKDPPKTKKVRDPVADFETRLKLERELLNATESRQKVLQALGSDFVRDNPKRAAAMEVTITETNRLIAVEEKRQGLIDSITGSIENGMMAMIDGTLSVKDAFKSMASEIIKELYRVLVVQQMVNAAKTAFGIPFADGGAFSGGSQIEAYANGGVVGSPTTFPMTGGKTGLMGEAGPEAIMPLKRGANGKLGVQMEGGGGDVININQSFNFQANGDDSVKKLIAQAAPKIADMAKASVIDSRRRGGSTKAAFG